jgi:hypothetical protein
MRFAVQVLACVSAGAVSLALADPPTTVPDTSTAPAAPTAPAATATNPGVQASPAPSAAATSAVTASAKAAIDRDEKDALARGYKLEMRHGERFFCRREETLGSRVEPQKVCAKASDLRAAADQTKDEINRALRPQTNTKSE